MSDTAVPIDSKRLFELAAAMPEQIEHGLRAARSLENLPVREKIENVVVLGMGASGVAGDILVATAGPFMSVPVTVVKSYELPAFVGEGSLVFAISASGNTEEIIDAATDAAVQGARIVVIAGGGQLAELAGGWSAPFVRLPKGLPSRSAIAAATIPALAVLEEIGLFPGAASWVQLAVDQLRKRRDELAAPGNIAEQIADALVGKLVVIHGGGSLGAAAAKRWKAQINANAKAPAFWAAQPDLCHNEALGWEALAEITRRDIAIVSLRHDDEHPQVVRRFELVEEHLQPMVSSVNDVRAEGDGDLAQLFDLVMIGDFVSLHLADRLGVDPAPVPFLSELKETLSNR